MSGNESRKMAVSAIIQTPQNLSSFDYHSSPTSSVWGKNVFGLREMAQRLSKPIAKSLKKTIETGGRLDPQVADAVAEAMKTWAIERGATHYAHVFYPLTGLTAEKHDSFFDPDGQGGTLASFEGKTLIQGEPDGSSFPSGGIRQTFEARGYTIWDVTSPAYILENANGTTLCIPTAFVSWTGEALDKKTPVLRSMQVLNAQAQRVLAFFGKAGPFVSSTAGAEQEYFLIDKHFYYLRPDLMAANRTLFGCPPPKGQEFEDHYFGAIPDRVLAFMFEVERECFKLGIPAKTRHNEVAPGQFELAPVFEFGNLATDHQQLVMTLLKKSAEKYGLVVLLHEKPFVGVNGSGKHLNFSLGSAAAGNLFDPGDTPGDNAQFLLFCAAMIQSVFRWGPLMRATVASASNDHRLGANEAPPAIMSIFLGAELTEVMHAIATGSPVTSKRGELNVGVDVIPPIPKHSGDRNRTSPMAFTGNRFEFRAVGSSQSIAGPLVVLNTILAESLGEFADRLEQSGAKSVEEVGKVVAAIVKDVWEHCSAVVFNGDGYSEAWHKEAAARGLANLKTAADALPEIKSHKVVELFERMKVLSPRETESRYEVYAEQYVRSVHVEANLMIEIAQTQIYPAAVRYQTELAETVQKLMTVGIEPDRRVLQQINPLVISLLNGVDLLAKLRVEGKAITNIEARCHFTKDRLIPAMKALRASVDGLESLLPDDHWPLPTYQEMLFIR